MFSLYVPGRSLVHRLPAGAKLLALAAGSSILFIVTGIPVHAAELVAVLVLFQVAGLPWREVFDQLRPALVFLVPIFLFHAFVTGWALGLETVLRILVLLLLAVMVTLTTRLSDMIDVLERIMNPLRLVGINPAKVSMMLSMVIRLIPLMMREAGEILEAQRARGLDRNAIALLVPLLIKALKMADDLSDAMDARATIQAQSPHCGGGRERHEHPGYGLCRSVRRAHCGLRGVPSRSGSLRSRADRGAEHWRHVGGLHPRCEAGGPGPSPLRSARRGRNAHPYRVERRLRGDPGTDRRFRSLLDSRGPSWWAQWWRNSGPG